jgi:N-acyl amino acid synthase of PEP-CTERM/exosortase system
MFDDHFDVYLADTAESKSIHYNIRYQVYCEEMGFEDKNAFDSAHECDEWDQSSTAHFIVRHKASNAWVGAIRLIENSHHLEFPVNIHCDLDQGIPHSSNELSVEVSRLCVVKEIRRRISDGEPPTGLYDERKDQLDSLFAENQFKNKRINRSVIWGLLYAAAYYCKINNLSNWYFMTTLGLAKILSQKGMILDSIGQPCNHNGVRFPYKMNVNQILTIPIWQEGYKTGFLNYSDCFENNQRLAA